MGAKGTSQFGDDVIVGSPEYLKRWREKNRDKARLAQAKYRQKQREKWLAMKLAVVDGISHEQALAEIRGKMEAFNSVKEKMEDEGKIPKRASWDVGSCMPEEPQIEFVKEMADKHNIDYEVALDIMDREADPSKWDTLMVEANHRKIEAIKDDIRSGRTE